MSNPREVRRAGQADGVPDLPVHPRAGRRPLAGRDAVRLPERDEERGYAGREYCLVLPDGGTNRIVRVFRVKNLAYLLLVEGTALPPSHGDVKTFFNSFYLLNPAK